MDNVPQGRAANKVDAPYVRHDFEHKARNQQRMEERLWHASGMAIPFYEQLDIENGAQVRSRGHRRR